MRYLSLFLERDLKKKLVFLSGPRQVGKSTLAKSLLGSKTNPEIPSLILDEISYWPWRTGKDQGSFALRPIPN